MNEREAIVPVVVVLVAGAAAYFLFVGTSAPMPPVPPPLPAPTRQTEPPPPPAKTLDVDPKEPDLGATLDKFFAKIPVRPGTKPGKGPRPKDVIEAARRAGNKLDPIDFKLALEKAIRAHGSREACGLLINGMTGFQPKILFQAALAISSRLDAAGTRVLLRGLDGADARVRPHVVQALRGSAAPEVQQKFVDLYARDQDVAVRAQAAFVIGERGSRIPPLLRERAKQVARGELTSDDARLVKAAGDVLGTAPIDDQDKRLLLTTLDKGRDSSQREVAFRALATAQVPPQELAPVLQRVMVDPKASARLRGLARGALEALKRMPRKQ